MLDPNYIFTIGLITTLLCIAIVVIWKIFSKFSLIPVIVGVGAWAVFCLTFEVLPDYTFLSVNSDIVNFRMGSMWADALLVLPIIGIVEETARFVSFKTVLKKYDDIKTAIGFGIGFGCAEALYLVGFNYMLMALAVYTDYEGILSGYKNFAYTFAGNLELEVFARMVAIVFHIALSILVFYAARNKKFIWVYPVCIVLHAIADFPYILYCWGVIDLLVNRICFAVASIILLIIALFVCKQYRRNFEKES